VGFFDWSDPGLLDWAGDWWRGELGASGASGGGGFPIEGRACGRLVVVGAVGDRRAISAPILRGPTFGRGPARGRALGGRESPGSKLGRLGDRK